MMCCVLRVRDILRLLKDDGWFLVTTQGSHRQFKHPNRALVITVPGNEGRELAPGTLRDILKMAGLK